MLPCPLFDIRTASLIAQINKAGENWVHMHIRIVTSAEDDERYDKWLRKHPKGTLWQSAEWRHYCEALGKKTKTYICEGEHGIAASALAIIDAGRMGLHTCDVPRGPLWTDSHALGILLQRIAEDAKHQKCTEVFFSPAQALPPHAFSGLKASGRHVHPQATLMIDLEQNEEKLLAAMHSKGRYNIRLAEKHGITIRKGSVDDIDAFYDLMKQTGMRDGFGILQKSHYTRFITALTKSFLLLAVHGKKPIAGLMGVTWNGTGIYYYGASSYEHRNLMAPYLLQWEAMRLCKKSGCDHYDLLGISAPDSVDDPWAGISDFKRKFGGTVITYPPEQTLVLRPMVKRALGLKRKLLG
jgi:lipid II:glycine glycyltransferase (peptidoglycan interpeptide bridge formation enzyme)